MFKSTIVALGFGLLTTLVASVAYASSPPTRNGGDSVDWNGQGSVLQAAYDNCRSNAAVCYVHNTATFLTYTLKPSWVMLPDGVWVSFWSVDRVSRTIVATAEY